MPEAMPLSSHKVPIAGYCSSQALNCSELTVVKTDIQKKEAQASLLSLESEDHPLRYCDMLTGAIHTRPAAVYSLFHQVIRNSMRWSDLHHIYLPVHAIFLNRIFAFFLDDDIGRGICRLIRVITRRWGRW